MGLINDKAIIGALRIRVKRVGTGVRKGLLAAGELAKRESQKTTPFRTGLLRSSHIVHPVRGGNMPAVDISVKTKYAIYVHENLDARHKSPTRAKFLERAVRENQNRIISIIRKHAKVD